MKPVKTTIFNQDYTLNCPESSVDKLHSCARQLDQAMTALYQKHQNLDADRISVLASLQLLLVMGERQIDQEVIEKINQTLKSLIKLVDQQLTM